MSVLTDKGRRTAWTRYLEVLAAELGLGEWSIKASNQVPDEEDAGHCEVIPGRRLARISIAPGQSAIEARDTAVHELVHVHLEPSVMFVREDLSEFVGEPAAQAFNAAFNRAFEYSVDGIALALAKHLPLPSEAALAALEKQR